MDGRWHGLRVQRVNCPSLRHIRAHPVQCRVHLNVPVCFSIGRVLGPQVFIFRKILQSISVSVQGLCRCVWPGESCVWDDWCTRFFPIGLARFPELQVLCQNLLRYLLHLLCPHHLQRFGCRQRALVSIPRRVESSEPGVMQYIVGRGVSHLQSL